MFGQRHRSWESSQQVSLLLVANFELQTMRIKLKVLAAAAKKSAQGRWWRRLVKAKLCGIRSPPLGQPEGQRLSQRLFQLFRFARFLATRLSCFHFHLFQFSPQYLRRICVKVQVSKGGQMRSRRPCSVYNERFQHSGVDFDVYQRQDAKGRDLLNEAGSDMPYAQGALG